MPHPQNSVGSDRMTLRARFEHRARLDENRVVGGEPASRPKAENSPNKVNIPGKCVAGVAQDEDGGSS